MACDKNGISEAANPLNGIERNYGVQLGKVSMPTNGLRPEKSLEVLEKEYRLKFLLEAFPEVDAMMVHSVLSKNAFNTERAVTDLASKYEKRIIGSYDEWLEQKNNSNKTTSEIDTLTEGQVNLKEKLKFSNLKRKEPPTDRLPSSGLTKKRAKKRKIYNSDTDSNDEGKFVNCRVYDSDEDSDTEVNNILTPEKKGVFEFFQKASSQELQLMTSCSKKKVDAIMEVRPFHNWVDLVQKLQGNKYLSCDLLNAAQQVISTRHNIRILMKRCSNLAQQLERAIADGTAGIKDQPKLLADHCKLTSYQMIGLNWLVVLHAQNVNGILADEMGLGKTVQVIAFLAYLKETGKAKGKHLVVVPSSTLDNWKAEFERWCPSMNVLMYYGSTEERRQYRIMWGKGQLADYDVILTTYTMVGNSPEERKMFRVTKMHYVVFDEAHMLKNMNTQRYEQLIRINASNRILLTGTPLQNNLLELMSLLVFVMPNIFAEKVTDLKSLFQKNAKVKSNADDNLPTFEKEQIEQAKRIMKPFVLRRLKRDVLRDLPKKTEELVEVPMIPSQKIQYETLVNTFQNASKQDPNKCGYNGVTMMTELRKLSNHPLLMRNFYKNLDLPEIAKKLASDPSYKETKVEYIIEDLSFMSDFEIHSLTKEHKSIRKYALPDSLIVSSGKFQYLDKKLKALKEGGHRVLIFSQYVIMLNVLEEYLTINNYSYLRLDGNTSVGIRQQLIDDYKEDDTIFIFLLSTKAGGLGVNLTSADTVIIHDIDFNPYNDKQAEDRCHRMGQKNPVHVYRLISQGTIEEGMWQLNKEKLKLEKDITTDEGDNPDVKSVVRLLSSVLGIDSSKVTKLVSPQKPS